MGGRTSIAAMALIACVVACGPRTDVGSPASTDSPAPTETPIPTSGTTRPEISVEPFNGQRVIVHVDGPESQSVSLTIYRDGLLFAARSNGFPHVGSRSSIWSLGGTLEGHTFVFLFQRADDSEFGRATVSVPRTSAVANPGSASPPSSSATARPTLPPEPAPTPTPVSTGPVVRGTVSVQPIDPRVGQIVVVLAGRPGDVVTYVIYRDGVMQSARSAPMVLTADGLYVGYGSPVLAPDGLQGHTFRFDFTAQDGSLYASASVLYPLPPGATIAPDAPVGAPPGPTAPPIPPGTMMRGTITVDPIVPGVATIGVLLRGSPGDAVSYTIYRDGLQVSPRSPLRVITVDGMHVTYDGSQRPDPITGHVLRFDFTAADGALYASVSVLYPNQLPAPSARTPTPAPTPTAPPTPRPTTGTTTPAVRIDTMTSTGATISFTATPNSHASCAYLQDGKPVFFETGRITVDATGIGKCGVSAGSGRPPLTSVFVIVVFLEDGSELGRATLAYPLP